MITKWISAFMRWRNLSTTHSELVVLPIIFECRVFFLIGYAVLLLSGFYEFYVWLLRDEPSLDNAFQRAGAVLVMFSVIIEVMVNRVKTKIEWIRDGYIPAITKPGSGRSQADNLLEYGRAKIKGVSVREWLDSQLILMSSVEVHVLVMACVGTVIWAYGDVLMAWMKCVVLFLVLK